MLKTELEESLTRINTALSASSVQFSLSVMSNSLQPHGLQHTRPPCPPPSPRVCLSSCPLHQWCHPAISILLCPFLLLPSIFPSIRDFSNELVVCTRWPKYWSSSFSTSPSNEYLGLISFKIYWFDLLAAKGLFKGLLQHHSSKAPTPWCPAFFMIQLSITVVTMGRL